VREPDRRDNVGSTNHAILLTQVVTEEDGQYVSHCPELGTVSCGSTIDEAFANLEEAIEVHLSALVEVED
jgi:predicted RNase H-like HicB family nuclease